MKHQDYNLTLQISPGNIYRFIRILFPPKPEILSKMCQQGFDDALKFLQRRSKCYVDCV